MSITVEDWRSKHDQAKLAAWFRKSHDSDTHIQFFIGSAKGALPNWSPNANPIEAWHRTLGDLPSLIMRASFTNMLEVNLPAICKDASLMLAHTSWLTQPSFIPLGMLETAQARLGDCLLHSEDMCRFEIMSRAYKEKHKVEKGRMNDEMRKKYRLSLKGKFPERVTKEEAQDICGYCHVIVEDVRYKGPSNTGWRCDCKGFVQFSICSHVLLVAHFCGQIDIKKLLAPCAAAPSSHQALEALRLIPAPPCTCLGPCMQMRGGNHHATGSPRCTRRGARRRPRRRARSSPPARTSTD